MKRAIFYCTFDGVANVYHGTGTQTEYFVGMLTSSYDALVQEFGAFDVHVVIPDPAGPCPRYDVNEAHYAAMKQKISSVPARLWEVPHGAEILWCTKKWEEVSQGAARAIKEVLHDYHEVLVIGVDAMYTPLADALDDVLTPDEWRKLKLVTAFFSSSKIPGTSQTPGRLELEQRCVDRAEKDPNVFFADFGEYLSRHLVEEYGLDPRNLVPLRQALDLDHSRFVPLREPEAKAKVAEFGVPLDLPVIFSMSRADPIKGVPRVIEAVSRLTTPVHLVLIAVPYSPEDPEVEQYRSRLESSVTSYTYITQFQTELPRALCSLPEVRAVVCASIGEPVGQIPQEVSLWARHGGPLVVAPAEGGFVEQMVHEHTGFLYEQGSIEDMTRCLERVLAIPGVERKRFQQEAFERTIRTRAFPESFRRTLSHMWATPGD